MPVFAFDKIIKIIQTILIILQFALKAFGFDAPDDSGEKD